MYVGCPACAPNAPSNVHCVYDMERVAASWNPALLASREPTLWRYWELLPIEPEHRISLGEGLTPLVHLRRLGERLGVSSLYLKDESQNPTWSFKDRMASVGASVAVAAGPTALPAPSSGTAGAAVAAYAARAGLAAIIVTTPSFPLTMRVFMQVYGAYVLATDSAPDRWKLVRHGVENHGWVPIQNFHNPPIGANPYAQEGCKAMGLEIAEQLEWRSPDAIIFPVTSGDTLAGTWRAFLELVELGTVTRMPRLVAAEVFGSLRRAIEQGLDATVQVPTRPSVAVSAASANSAYQSLVAIRASGGTAVETGDDEEILQMQAQLAEDEGIFAEAAAVLPLVAASRLRAEAWLAPDDVVVVVSTSGGLKDPEVAQHRLPEIPVIEPVPEAMAATLREVYGFEVGG
jgi:threonine synthase